MLASDARVRVVSAAYIDVPVAFHVGFTHTWEQLGVAPCLESGRVFMASRTVAFALVCCCNGLSSLRLTYRPRSRTRLQHFVMTEPPKKETPNPLKALNALADASWDMFVMPGEAANSLYDRPLPTEEPANESTSTFDWGGDSKADDALRLPTGVKAAERLSVPVQRPRGLWFEVEGRDIKGDTEFLSRTWTIGWGVFVVVALTAAIQTGFFEMRIGAPMDTGVRRDAIQERAIGENDTAQRRNEL